MLTTTRTVIRKNADGTYDLMTNLTPDYLCVMTQVQFEELVRDLERLRDEKVTGNGKNVWFPDFTRPITG